jgi:hypothetical protein
VGTPDLQVRLPHHSEALGPIPAAPSPVLSTGTDRVGDTKWIVIRLVAIFSEDGKMGNPWGIIRLGKINLGNTRSLLFTHHPGSPHEMSLNLLSYSNATSWCDCRLCAYIYTILSPS